MRTECDISEVDNYHPKGGEIPWRGTCSILAAIHNGGDATFRLNGHTSSCLITSTYSRDAPVREETRLLDRTILETINRALDFNCNSFMYRYSVYIQVIQLSRNQRSIGANISLSKEVSSMSRSSPQTITNKRCRQVRILLAVQVLIMSLYFYYLEVVILTLVLFSWL
ncbi:hypothetical protein Hanom_Chr06g00545611 [Helianthus anomalus]